MDPIQQYSWLENFGRVRYQSPDEDQGRLLKKAYNRARRLWNKQGNSSKVTAEIPAARLVEEVLTRGGFSAAVSRQPEADPLRQQEREKEEVS